MRGCALEEDDGAADDDICSYSNLSSVVFVSQMVNFYVLTVTVFFLKEEKMI